MKNIFTLFIVLIAISARAQSYFVSQIPYNPMPFDSGVNVVSSIDDVWSAPIPIGFDFYFFGVPHQSLILGTNSLVTFTLSLANQYCQWPISDAIPSTANPTNSIMFPFQDVNPALGGTIHHQVYGAPPNRKFVLSFDSVPYYACTTIYFTGQLILYEGTGNIEMQLHLKDLCSTWNSGAGILGVQDSTGTEAYWASNYNYPTQWTANDEAWLFSPDSNYATSMNRISGRVFADLDHDCSFNNSDYALMNKPVIFDDGGGNQQYAFTDMLGYYSKLVNAGTYSFSTANIANQYYSSNCPVGGSYSVTFTGIGDSSDNNLFADTIVNFCADNSISMWMHGETDSLGWWDPLGVCDTGYVELSLANSGSMNDTVDVLLTLNDSTQILSANYSYSNLGGNEYQFSGIPMDAGNTASISVMILAGCDTIGTWYCFSASVSGAAYDCQSYNNNSSSCLQIGVPFDPNEMYVSSSLHPQNGASQFLVTEPQDNFTYTVTFQNTGSAVAHNVIVKTLLDNHLNATTITPGISSYPYNWLILGDTLILDFTGIELPDSNTNEAASHGFVKFSVQQIANNAPGTIIPQQANIYFDYLAAVTTNDAIVQIENPESAPTINTATDASVILYPNPARNIFSIFGVDDGSYVVADITGKILQQGIVYSKTDVNVAALSSGIYFISIQTTEGNFVRKLVKE